MFERFTDRARRVVALAQEEAEPSPAAPRPGLSGWRERVQLAEILDQRIAQIRCEKESAVDAEDYEMAAALRARERQLIAQKASRQQSIDLRDGAA
jgi:hypothetical protein